MEELLRFVADYVGLGCELATGFVIAVGAIEALARLALAGKALGDMSTKREIWVHFASWILLALEFALAADIARTALAPSWDAIGQLAAIAGIRTALSYFLSRDVEDFRATEGRQLVVGKEPKAASDQGA